jgi:TonB family protein
MTSARKWTFACLCFAAFPIAIAICGDTKADDTPTTNSPLTVGTAKIRMDPTRPIKLHENYPAESRRLHEAGICGVRVEVDTAGDVLATQLISSAGFERLDAACLANFANGHLLPAAINGTPVTRWASIPVAWNTTGAAHTFRPERFNDEQLPVPIVQTDYELQIGLRFYPDTSREMHQQGDCTVHVFVKEDGTATNISVTRSTRIATLDQACILAIQQAPFIPAHKDGIAVAAWADINIIWRLPAN